PPPRRLRAARACRIVGTKLLQQAGRSRRRGFPMPQQVSLIAPLVAGLALAYVLGTLASRLRMPPLIGYIVAGLVVGPHTPGLVVEPGLAQALSEAGIILVMFGIG